jgi:hypothetical protein
MRKRTAHRADNRAACLAGVVCSCGHCVCDHYGVGRPGTQAFCDGLTAAGDVRECECVAWRIQAESSAIVGLWRVN